MELQEIITSYFGEDISYISWHGPLQLLTTVQKLFTDFPTNNDAVDAKHYIEDLYQFLPGSLSDKGLQSTFGFQGVHPQFLARLAIYTEKNCYKNIKTKH